MDLPVQMCWCVSVCFKVLRNLTHRVFIDLLDAAYGMGAVFCCWRTRSDLEDETIKALGGTQDPIDEFYKQVNRNTAEDLLRNKQNGTFIVRPSKNSNLGALSLVQDSRVFHLTIRRREDGLVALGSEKTNEKCFCDLNGLINYYISNYLVLYSHGERYKALLLPFRDEINDL